MKYVPGFTLIELIIVMTVTAIALTIGIPGFSALIQNNRIASQSNELITTFQYARSEAIKRGVMISVCGSDDGSACHGNTEWQGGWIVFVDVDGDGVRDVSDANTDDDDEDNKILRSFGGLKGDATLAAPAAITYIATGQVITGANLNLALSAMGGDLARCIGVSQIGRVASEPQACPS